MFDMTRVFMAMLVQRWKSVRANDEGATAVEYAVILALAFVAATAVAAVIVKIVDNRMIGLA
jgi:Flp pilus assembly pilin Flp